MNLKDRILELKRNTSSVTSNPILEEIEIEDCERIDFYSLKDNYVKERKRRIVEYAKNLGVDFHTNYILMFNDYSEVISYLDLKDKYQIQGIVENKKSVPDFCITFDDSTFFIEHKTLSYFDGIHNFKKVQQKALQSKIEIEEQIKRGQKTTISSYSIAPYFREGKYNDSYSVKLIIEGIIKKIKQNIKKSQFEQGDTLLMIDTRLLIIPSKLEESCVPFFLRDYSIVSGVLWNVAFGRIGNLILKSAEFHPFENIDGQLIDNGILIDYPFIKGLIFIHYRNRERRMLGFFKNEDGYKPVTKFLGEICSFINNETNFFGFKLYE